MDIQLNDLFASQWLVLMCIVAILLALAEIGFESGLRLHQAEDEARKSQVGPLQAAVLGLLALLLGFTFAMAVQRYDVRHELVVKAANSIGTAYLRAELLPEPHGAAVQNLLRRYVDLRLDFYAAGDDALKLAATEQSTWEVQRELWSHAVAAGQLSDTPLSASFVAALNDTIDLDAARLAALKNRIPVEVWLLLILVAGCGCWATGYGAGTTGQRTVLAQVLFPLLIAVVITVLVDFSAPRQGLIRVSQESLVMLKQSLARSAK